LDDSAPVREEEIKDQPSRANQKDGMERTPERPARAQAVGRLRRALTALAYASLVLDVCIAVVTSAGALRIADLQPLLVPVNYALTAVVILSAAVFVTLLVEKVA
jgi:hypothetical protein